MAPTRNNGFVGVALICITTAVNSFTAPHMCNVVEKKMSVFCPSLSLHGTLPDVTEHDEVTSERRSALFRILLVGGTALTASSPMALAAKDSSSQIDADKAKVVKGYKRLDYLLQNWEKETTVCKRNDNPYQGCDRTPEKVMEYLGFKSMEDPLFRADKTLMRLQLLVTDRKQELEFQDALDVWMEKAEEGNGMAFISSWGEANPGGGRDRVALFIERARKDVEASRDSLKTVIRILGLDVN